MAKKNETLSKQQTEILKRNHLTPLCWAVLQDLNHSMIVKHKVTGEIKVIDK